MATYNNNLGTTGHPAAKRRPYLTTTVIDFSSTTNAANDVFRAINIPANSVVLNAGIDVTTANTTSGTAGTLALGDGSVTYVAAATISTAGQMTNGDAVAEMFVVYDAANTLDVTVATSVVNAVVTVWALVCDLNDPDEDEQAVTFTAA